MKQFTINSFGMMILSLSSLNAMYLTNYLFEYFSIVSLFFIMLLFCLIQAFVYGYIFIKFENMILEYEEQSETTSD